MTIDTEIRHVTKPGVNLFPELGFDYAEAVRLQAKSAAVPKNEPHAVPERLHTG